MAPTTFVMEKWGVRVSVEGNVPGQYELGNLPGEKNHQWHLHLQFGRVQRFCNGRTKTAPCRGRNLILSLTVCCGGGCPDVWPQRFRLPAGDGGAVMVHFRMLPCPRQQLDDRECHHRAQGATPGLRNNIGRILNVKLSEMEEGRNRGGAYYRRFGGYFGQLPPAPLLMVSIREDMEYDLVDEEGDVLDGLHHGDVSPSLWECVYPGPQA